MQQQAYDNQTSRRPRRECRSPPAFVVWCAYNTLDLNNAGSRWAVLCRGKYKKIYMLVKNVYTLKRKVFNYLGVVIKFIQKNS